MPRLDTLTAPERIEWALGNLPGRHIVSSSFGAQSAVMLHMVTRVEPDITVVLIDTGYLFPETYGFVDHLVEELGLNLEVFRPLTSPAWQEARHGRRWEQGASGIEDYNRENKVEPMERALDELGVGTWLSGVRRMQSASRASLPLLASKGDRFKVHPIADWNDRDIHRYLVKHGLPYHPLWEKGFVSIGDVHTTRSLLDAKSVDETRFFGLKRECGLHEMDYGKIA